MQIKKLILTVGIAVIVGLSLGFYFYNKPADGIADASAVYSLNTNELTDAFNQNEQLANEKYLGKVIEVSGKVLMTESGERVVITLEGSDMSNVRAEMIKGFKLDKNIAETNVTLKGKCTGLLLDVVLNECIILE